MATAMVLHAAALVELGRDVPKLGTLDTPAKHGAPGRVLRKIPLPMKPLR